MNIVRNKVNKYIVIDEKHDAVMYQVIAENEKQVHELAEKNGYDISDYSIELVRKNVVNEIGRPYSPVIYDEMITGDTGKGL